MKFANATQNHDPVRNVITKGNLRHTNTYNNNNKKHVVKSNIFLTVSLREILMESIPTPNYNNEIYKMKMVPRTYRVLQVKFCGSVDSY